MTTHNFTPTRYHITIGTHEPALRIADKLRSGKYVVNPEVTVSMMQVNSRQVSVLGNVNKPGRYPLDQTTSHLTDLLAVAGGVSATGSDQVTIVSSRDAKPTSTEIDIPTFIKKIASGNLLGSARVIFYPNGGSTGNVRGGRISRRNGSAHSA